MAFLLFDLDGTLTDPERGICACFRYAMEGMGRTPPPCAELHRFIGPPLHASFAELLGTDDETVLDVAMARYRERFSTVGLFENDLYPFVPGGLAALHAARHRLWVVTSKPAVYARRIVEHFGLNRYFGGVYGSELSGERSEKAELLTFVLRAEQLDPASSWMIGDRAYDVRAGVANGTHTVGVLWGYGSAPELADAGAEVVVETMEALVRHLEAAQS